ncbi:MAG TPA: GNAT family N-acetyltransferase [Chloroflexota bacterium]|nr:GNAT family N-acetyltransferase [Chloroflexota bacterium]
MAEGPRPLRSDEWGQLEELVDSVFRPGMFQQYPQLFCPENQQNLRVIVENGRVVSHVGMIERPASLLGCRIDVACIGSVATDPAYRGRGFASRLFQDCCDKAAADGVDIMLVSGSRGLYTRVGCRRVGRDLYFLLTAEEAAPARPRPGDEVALRPLDAGWIPSLQALYEQEPVRFLRPREDWEKAFASQVVMARRAEFWGVFAGATLLAYLIVHPPREMQQTPSDRFLARVVEYAGDRAAIAGALPALRTHYQVEAIGIHVLGTDATLRARLEVMGLTGTLVPSWGTLRVINFPSLMERCRPLLAGRLGAAAVRALRFEADNPPGSPAGGFTIRCGPASLRLADPGALASYLFGDPEGGAVQPEGSPALAAELARALPLPALWYGINYV